MRKPTFGVQAAYLKKLKEDTYIPLCDLGLSFESSRV